MFGENTAGSEVAELSLLVEQARKSWENAKTVFEQVCDPELVDIAIHDMESASLRYRYLLKLTREAWSKQLPIAE